MPDKINTPPNKAYLVRKNKKINAISPQKIAVNQKKVYNKTEKIFTEDNYATCQF